VSESVEGRHVVMGMGEDDVMHLAAIIVVSDMVPEGREFYYGKEITGGAPEVLMGPKTYAERMGEDADG
jgi:hypothetical protein